MMWWGCDCRRIFVVEMADQCGRIRLFLLDCWRWDCSFESVNSISRRSKFDLFVEEEMGWDCRQSMLCLACLVHLLQVECERINRRRRGRRRFLSSIPNGQFVVLRRSDGRLRDVRGENDHADLQWSRVSSGGMDVALSEDLSPDWTDLSLSRTKEKVPSLKVLH